MSRKTRPHRASRLWRAQLMGLLLVGVALPAAAARVVDVRVGQHPTFTRVVFELDQMRGYRLARGDSVLNVRLDANAKPETLKSRGMVSRVVVEQSVDGAVARIHLNGSPRVREMILGKPPRIVLDVMKPAAMAAAPTRRKPAVAPKPAVADPEPPVIVAEPEPVIVAVPEPEPVVVAEPEPVMPEPEPLPVEVPAALDPIEEPDPGDAHAGDGPDTPDTIAGMVDDPDLVVGGEEPALLGVIDEPTPQLADTTPDPVTSVRPSGFPFPAAEDAVGPLANPVVLGGVGLAVVGLVAFFVMRRRRRAAAGGDPMADSIHEMPGGETVDVGSTRIPAGGFSMEDARESEAPLGGPSTDDSPFATPDVPSHDGPTAPVPRPANVVSIFEQDQSANQGDSPMSDVMSDLPANPASAPVSAAPLGGSAGGDVAQMMEAMERRMGDLESRLEAANEAREKLERQVAAQAEELRVQRAAIARTQRALRGMTRTSDDKATEPALREDTQARTRVTGA